ncbi:uncharacterized protein LOC118491556 [Helianthus annuus]|uniref:uncharacterized protein LOC118491556 n=1 Tax=Helianthus annuus TaxID=4232 RepID=UPI0016532890|nr:uncharacterized protein LOC118491556 [Helianthus annuus]
MNVKDEDGETPLIHAARQGHITTAKYLFEHGADPSLSSEGTGSRAEIMMEVNNRREKEGGIIPDPDIGTFIKVIGEVAFVGFDVAIQTDISAEKMSFGVLGVNPHRRAELIKVLDIDLSWRMHKVFNGQRRRVQICMGLLKEVKKRKKNINGMKGQVNIIAL